MNDTAAAWFVGILLAAIAAVYTAALVAFGVWFVREWVRENRRRRDWSVRLDSARTTLDAADAVLAVVADWLAAQPVGTVGNSAAQRDHDVNLLRGGSDV